MKEIKIGDIVPVVVTGMQKYGVFVLVNNKDDGLIHISEISNGFVRNINDYVRIKDQIYAKVIDIDNGKYKLSIKDIDYRNGGDEINTGNNCAKGFESLKSHLNIWIDDKIQEIMDKM